MEKRYATELDEVREMFNKFRIRGQEPATIVLTRDYNKQWNRSKTSYKPAPPMALPHRASTYTPDLGTIEMRYSRTAPEINNGKLIWNADKKALFFENMPLTENELDYAWFMLKGTNYLKNGIFKIVDAKTEYSKQFDEVLLQRDVQNLLFDDNVTEEQLAKVATEIFEPAEIDYKSISGKEELAIKIWQKVDARHKNKSKPNYADLKEICERFGLGKEPKKEEAPQVIGLDDGSEIALEKAPKEVTMEELREQAKELDISSFQKKKDVLYTLIKHAKEKLELTGQKNE